MEHNPVQQTCQHEDRWILLHARNSHLQEAGRKLYVIVQAQDILGAVAGFQNAMVQVMYFLATAGGLATV